MITDLNARSAVILGAGTNPETWNRCDRRARVGARGASR